MSDRRTFASVTDVPCTCVYLQRAADNPDKPIVFDPLTGEFHFSTGSGIMVIYHCPFCGGAAPESKRALLFAVIPSDEQQRLARLLAPVMTVRGALKRLGKPQQDDAAGTRTESPERIGQPPSIEHFRTLVYERLSEVADVRITERSDGAVHWSLNGKYIGSRSSEGSGRRKK